MAKIPLNIAEEVVARRRGGLRLAAALGAAALLAPLAWEGCAILISNWYEVMGKSYVVKTPILDFLSQTYEGSRDDLHEFLVPYLGSMSWRPELVFPILLALMVVGVRVLWRAPT